MVTMILYISVLLLLAEELHHSLQDPELKIVYIDVPYVS